jgi:ribosome maturation factor RimP
MNFRSTIEKLLQEALDQNPNLFLIDFTMGSDNSIRVILDGDKGVTLQDCVSVSRAIEHQLDRDEYDFSLEVASVGVGSPLQNERQYQKNIGRKIHVEFSDRPSMEGLLSEADAHSFTMTWKQREPKPIGKGKVTVTKQKTLSYTDVVSSKVLVK